MLDYLKFIIGRNEKYTHVTVSVAAGIVSVSVENMLYPEYNIYNGKKKLTQKASRRWLKWLDAININEWKSDYSSAIPSVDCERWSLEYKLCGRRCKNFFGIDDYPPDWEKFIELMDSVSPIIDPDRVDSVDLIFNQKIVINSDDVVNIREELTFLYKEVLSVDRYKNRVVIRKQYTPSYFSTFSYNSGSDVADLLDAFGDRFKNIAKPETSDSEKAPKYELKIKLHKKRAIVIKSSYDRHGLPDWWKLFIVKVGVLIKSQADLPEIFNHELYEHGALYDEYIYCSVAFGDSEKTYYYRTEDDTLRVGDEVIVPVGDYGYKKAVNIVKIEYFTKETLPMPLEQVKKIIGRAADEE